VMFSRNRNAEPPARENVTGTQYTSPPLGAGRWWFILRTHGKDGGWTDTLRRGPFVIVIPTAVVPPPKAAAKKPVRHRHVRKARHQTPLPVANQAKQLVLDFHASAPPRSRPAPKPRAAPKPKPKPKPPPKPPKPTQPLPAPAPVPPATPQPAPAPPPAVQPVTPAPPAGVEDDNEHGDDEDDDDQGEDHDDHGGGKGHGHAD